MRAIGGSFFVAAVCNFLNGHIFLTNTSCMPKSLQVNIPEPYSCKQKNNRSRYKQKQNGEPVFTGYEFHRP